MQFDSEVVKFLDGEAFSKGLRVPIARRPTTTPDRITLIAGYCAGKRVVHVGCADHIDLIEPKMREGTWLHGRLVESASRCLGIDIDRSSIARMHDLGYRDAVAADLIVDDIPELQAERWDVMVLGEILEHLDDPFGFLRTLNARWGGQVERMIVTVPNAFAWEAFRAAASGFELINTDHRFWFTPYTLAKVMTRAGLAPESYRFCDSFPPPARQSPLGRAHRSIRHAVFAMAPALNVHLVMAARFGSR